MLPKTLGSYGGPHVDTTPESDPKGQVPAALYDRQCEDVAQMTLTSPKAIVWFYTTAVAAPVVYAAVDVNHASHWGNGASTKPTVEKTAVGRYTITYAATFADALAVVETVNLRVGKVTTMLANPLDDHAGKPLTVAANVATIQTESPRMTPADDGDVSGAVMLVCVELF